MIKDIVVFLQNDRYSSQILMKLEFSQQAFQYYSNIKFHENPFNGSRIVPCDRTDRRDKVNSHFVTKNVCTCVRYYIALLCYIQFSSIQSNLFHPLTASIIYYTQFSSSKVYQYTSYIIQRRTLLLQFMYKVKTQLFF